MKVPKSIYRYSIRETPDSLVIQFRGRKQYGGIIFMSLFFIFFLAIISLHLALQFTSQHGFEPEDLFIIGMTLFYFLYMAIVSPYIVQNSLLDHQTITIMDHAVRVEKSGFRFVQLQKEFPLRVKPIFHLGYETKDSKYISFSWSIAMARVTRLLPLDPMRYFCPRISPENGLAILERIGAKFPQFDIHKDREFNLNLKPG